MDLGLNISVDLLDATKDIGVGSVGMNVTVVTFETKRYLIFVRLEKLEFKMGIHWVRRSVSVVLVPNVGISASVNTGEKSFGAFDVGRLERYPRKLST